MIELFYIYNLRQIFARKGQTFAVLFGVSLVVIVFCATLMLSAGLKKTLAGTGSERNAMIIRTGAENEVQSGIPRDNALAIEANNLFMRDSAGMPMVTKDIVVLSNLDKIDGTGRSNVVVRGTNQSAYAIRPEVALISGRLPVPGTNELIVGQALTKRFIIDSVLRLSGIDYPIVGYFDAGQTGFSSEIWGDAEVLARNFNRQAYSSVVGKLASGVSIESLETMLEGDKRLGVSVQTEKRFYESQSEKLSLFITILGTFVSVIFSLAAALGAMISMFGSVSSRRREIGILRSLGFGKLNIFICFLLESTLLGLIGGIVGVCLSSFLMFFSLATTNFSTFSEIGFGFSLTPVAIILSLLFATIIGGIGGIIPAYSAARGKILEVLRAN